MGDHISAEDAARIFVNYPQRGGQAQGVQGQQPLWNLVGLGEGGLTAKSIVAAGVLFDVWVLYEAVKNGDEDAMNFLALDAGVQTLTAWAFPGHTILRIAVRGLLLEHAPGRGAYVTGSAAS
eukprot:2182938-Rhodomonas_salina.1